MNKFAQIVWIKHSVSRCGERAAGSDRANTLLRHYGLGGYGGLTGMQNTQEHFLITLSVLLSWRLREQGASGRVTAQREREREVRRRCKWQIDIVWVTAACERSRQVCGRWSVLSGEKDVGTFSLTQFINQKFPPQHCWSQREREWGREPKQKELRSKAGVFKMCPKSQGCRSSATRTHVQVCKIDELKRLPDFSHMKEWSLKCVLGPGVTACFKLRYKDEGERKRKR